MLCNNLRVLVSMANRRTQEIRPTDEKRYYREASLPHLLFEIVDKLTM